MLMLDVKCEARLDISKASIFLFVHVHTTPLRTDEMRGVLCYLSTKRLYAAMVSKFHPPR